MALRQVMSQGLDVVVHSLRFVAHCTCVHPSLLRGPVLCGPRGDSEMRGAPPMAQPPRRGGSRTICHHGYAGQMLVGDEGLVVGIQEFDENFAILSFLSMIR